ncbi:hypothetical protein BD626DRAFT_483605 [Schizophyllum amplum]|uniref:Fe2OG dioxygenase domain-containing protein n=1 Tax=Schizophyllum amplum TaxID=97359 RepID=A0A550CPH8_9AGAR|nr:hypothetical protein BD626DRAFT_483605 [Auriculariopsis ampla]
MNAQDHDEDTDRDACSSPDSLFDGELDACSLDGAITLLPARRTAPPVPGLLFYPHILIQESLARDVYAFCRRTYFTAAGADQVMLFERAPAAQGRSERQEVDQRPPSGLPAILLSLLRAISESLALVLPPDVHALLFSAAPKRARQIIVNLYAPGEGISAHVDLLKRYGDGIVGVSFGSGCVMRFSDVGDDAAANESYNPGTKKDDGGEREFYDVYLPERSFYVMMGDARYRWTHGIERRREDYVETEDGDKAEWIGRGERLSVTFRWMLEGGDVL